MSPLSFSGTVDRPFTFFDFLSVGSTIRPCAALLVIQSGDKSLALQRLPLSKMTRGVALVVDIPA